MEKKIANFVIIAHGGQLVQPYVSQVELWSDDPDFEDFMDDEPGASFDDWCNEQLNDLADALEQAGASVIVLSLEEYQGLPKF